MSKYAKISQTDHILLRPGMYIGSITPETETYWTCEIDKFKPNAIRVSPGLIKIFDEILVNAIDQHSIHHKKINEIKIEFNNESISVLNYGVGIEIKKHEEEQIWIPELIFGHLLTSSNYDDNDQRVTGGMNGIGAKCLALGLKLVMFDGSVKMAGNVKIGDVLIGDDGTPRNVLSTQFGHGAMYEVSQCMGESYKVNDQHILTLHMPDHKVIFWNSNGWGMIYWKNEKMNQKFIKAYDDNIECPECKTILQGSLKRHHFRIHPDVIYNPTRKSPTKPDMTDVRVLKALDEMKDFASTIDDNSVFDMCIQDYLKLNKTTQKRLAGVRGLCVNWPLKDVLLDPYVLGLWLGDGMQTGYAYACDGENDFQIMDYLENWGFKNNATFKIIPSNKYSYRITATNRNNKAPLKRILEKYNLVNNKHIPSEYLVNSREVRLALLAGFIDSDGSVSRDGTRVQISQSWKHEDMIFQLQHLSRSLGFYCCMTSGMATYKLENGEERESKAFYLNISGDLQDIPTLLPRKKCKNSSYRNMQKSTGAISVNKIEDSDYIGITIDGNERFVMEDFTVTHNCTNIFSSQFRIKISDGKKTYSQTWKKNMSQLSEPEIIPVQGDTRPYVFVNFTPDWDRFGGFNPEFFKVIEKRAWDAALWCKCCINLNGKSLPQLSLEDFARMYIGDLPIAKMKTSTCEFVVAHSTVGFQQVSFVNGIATTKGGTHVDKFVQGLVAEIGKDKKITVKPTQIKSTLFIFMTAIIVNPTFSSQAKVECTSKFAEPFDIKPKFIKDVLNTGVLDDLVSLGLARVEKDLKKTDGSKKSRISGIPKLDDANWAGTHKSSDCTLIITEGDSAKALAIAGLGVVGRNAYGVFPLRGKPRNVRDATTKQVTENEEFSNLKKILGLQHGKVYTNLKDLRYGRLMIMCDSDLDGSHIKGLVLNMFHVYWPKLIELGFLVSMVTPVVKVGKQSFFTEEAYRASSVTGDVKYYKGLGTSTSAEAKEYFKQIDRLTVAFSADTKTSESMTLAFAKARTDDRKEWLTTHMASPPPGVKYGSVNTLSVSDFIHLDLANFSAEDIKRSIPHVADGLKPSQRKVIYACLKKNLTKDMKVAQLSGYVAEQTAYHHGETSLQGTIVNLAQNFVGSNNLNLLVPSGQLGTRIAGGKDAASARYIFTRLSPETRSIFHPDDDPILTYVLEDGEKVEPQYYSPTIPMILVNGAEGIGTGFSSYVPPYDVSVLKQNIINCLNQVAMIPMIPTFRGFKGTIEKTKDHTWIMSGSFVKIGNQIHITELPPGRWIQDFKEHLDDLLEKNVIQKYENHSTEIQPDFRIWGIDALTDPMKDLGLTKTIHTSNMHLIGPDGSVKKYQSPEEILVDYIGIRLEIYKKRKAHLLSQLLFEMDWLNAKCIFIQNVIKGSIKIFKVCKSDIQVQLQNGEFHEKYWDRLLNIKTYQYSNEEVQSLVDLCSKKKNEYDIIKKTSVSQFWKKDLETAIVDRK